MKNSKPQTWPSQLNDPEDKG